MEQPRSGVELYFAQDVATFFVLISPNMCQGLGEKGVTLSMARWCRDISTESTQLPSYPNNLHKTSSSTFLDGAVRHSRRFGSHVWRSLISWQISSV